MSNPHLPRVQPATGMLDPLYDSTSHWDDEDIGSNPPTIIAIAVVYIVFLVGGIAGYFLRMLVHA